MTERASTNLGVDGDRLWADIMALAKITDPAAPYTRRSFSKLFLDGRQWLTGRFREAGLTTRIDTAGNLIGRMEGADPKAGTSSSARIATPSPRAGASTTDPHAVPVRHVGVPDGTLGIDADPVGVVIPREGLHPPVAQVAVRADVVGREPVAVGLGDDQRGPVGRDRHAVGKREVPGDQADRPAGRGERDTARRGLAAGEVEPDGIDVGVTVRVHDKIVPRLVGDGGQVGMGDHLAIRLAAQQPPPRRVHDQQPPVGQEVDAHRERGDADYDFVTTAGVERDHLVGAPVGKPEPSVVPPR